MIADTRLDGIAECSSDGSELGPDSLEIVVQQWDAHLGRYKAFRRNYEGPDAHLLGESALRADKISRRYEPPAQYDFVEEREKHLRVSGVI